MYKMTAYTLNGRKYYTESSNNLEYFDRYKNKKNYRIEIKDGRKVVYSERRRLCF